MPRSTTIVARSLIFNALFYANLIVHMIVALPTLVLPHRILGEFIRSYAVTSLWLLRVICGIKVEWRGLEKVPKGACLVACKHQSLWETFALYAVLREPIYILKRELMWIPLFGWYAWKARPHSGRPQCRAFGTGAHDNAGAKGTRARLPARHLS